MRAEPLATPKGFLLKHACPRGGVGEYTPRARARPEPRQNQDETLGVPLPAWFLGGRAPGGPRGRQEPCRCWAAWALAEPWGAGDTVARLPCRTSLSPCSLMRQNKFT